VFYYVSYSHSSIVERDEGFSLYEKILEYRIFGVELRTILMAVQCLTPRPVDLLTLKCAKYSANRGSRRIFKHNRERNMRQKID
jgi:hypothetical protein